jgi:uncharacterized protein (DUF952 family)
VRIFHVATAADWQQARADGSYRTSTYGRSLARERFIHACRREQLAVSTGACLTVGGYLRQTDSAGAAASRVPSHG